MKARKSILGLILIIGMLLSCAVSAYAAPTKAPKFTTSKIAAGTHGQSYEATISVQDNADSSDKTINVSITPKASTDLKALGITPSYNSDGGLDLKSDKLISTTTGYKFTVTATNQWRKKETDKLTNGKTTKDYTLKITGIAPVITSPDLSSLTDGNISPLAGTSGYALQGVPIEPIYIATDSASPKVEMTATGLPDGIKLIAVSQPASGEPAPAVYVLSGSPAKTGSYTVKVKAANADKKSTGVSKASTVAYKLNVLGSPDITPKLFKDVTYGKKFSQKFAITGLGKGLALASADVVAYKSDGTAVSLDYYGLESDASKYYDANKGIFTISGTVDSIDMGYLKETSFDIGFRMKSPGYADVKEVKLNLKVAGIAPKINDKKTPQTAVSSLTRSEDITESIDIIAVGPGIISWDIDKNTPLPEGIVSSGPVLVSDDDGNMQSVLSLGGTPKVTAKGYGVNFIAKNAVGEAKITLKFTIGGTAPVITMTPDVTSTDNSPYTTLGINSGDVSISMSVDVGPVTWKAAKLPKGLSLVLTDADGKKVTTKTSQYAMITGKATAAMKDTDVATITATDPNTKLSSGAIDLLGLRVYPKAAIKGKKFPDIKIGTEYTADKTSGIKAEGVTGWIISVDKIGKLPAGLSFDSSDLTELKIIGQLNEVPVSGSTPIGAVDIKLQALGPGGNSDVTTVTLNIKGDAPKITASNSSLAYKIAEAASYDITITGTKPIAYEAYILGKDAKKVLGYDSKEYKDTEWIDISDVGLYITSADADNGITLTISKQAGTGYSFKNLNVNIEADNGLGKKPAKKAFKVSMEGAAPVWCLDGVAVSADFPTTINFTAKSADAFEYEFVASGDGPLTVTSTPDKKTNGIEIKRDENTVTIYATSAAEAKSTKVKLTAKNGDGTATLNLTFNGQTAPVIDYKAGQYKKEVEQNKKLSIALKLKSGTTPVQWKIANNSPTTADELVDMNLSLDINKGKIEGTPEDVTLSTDGATYATKTVWVYAENAAGSSDIVSVDIGVMGTKPKLASTSKAFTFVRGDTISQELATTDNLEGVIWTMKDSKKTLNDYVKGLELVSQDGLISGEPTVAVKGASVPVVMDNYGSKVNASIKITVVDITPEISPDATYVSLTKVKADAKGKTAAAYTSKLGLTISGDTKATGSSKITWKAGKPDDNRISVKVAADTSDKLGNKATVTVTLGKGKAVDTNDSGDVLPFSATFEVTATNSSIPKNGEYGETSDTIELTVYVTSSDTYVAATTNAASEAEDETIGNTAAIKDDIVTDDELTAELGEGDLTIGEERTVGMLTAGQAAILDEGRFVIAAILPEISATADGQYGLEVDLDENVKAGAKLYWFAFPKDAEASEDDEIIDFFELDGSDTEVVPENHVVAAYPWLRAGVTYGPVIAVKAEDAEEGEAVTEGELERTAEGETASETTEIADPAEKTEE